MEISFFNLSKLSKLTGINYPKIITCNKCDTFLACEEKEKMKILSAILLETEKFKKKLGLSKEGEAQVLAQFIKDGGKEK